jgi:hypothetical protein
MLALSQSLATRGPCVMYKLSNDDFRELGLISSELTAPRQIYQKTVHGSTCQVAFTQNRNKCIEMIAAVHNEIT